MRKLRREQVTTTIARIDAKLAEMPVTMKQGDNVVYTALWFYRDALAKELAEQSTKEVKK